jgi:NADH-quinone oxidoreductase E subunit
MAWQVEDRRSVKLEGGPYVTDSIKKTIVEKYLPRYPNKRAALLPALHLVQHEHGWIPTAALAELAELLGIAPAEALDTATFYEEYWLKPKGKYLIQVCRSLACEICSSRRLTDRIRKKLNIEVGETTPDGRFTLIELECLGACGTAPVALINEVLYENLTPESLDKLIDSLPADPHKQHDPTIDWSEGH